MVKNQLKNRLNFTIEQKAEELKKREIELTKRWLTSVEDIDIADLDLKDEKQAVQIIEQGTLDFYLNRKKSKRKKNKQKK